MSIQQNNDTTKTPSDVWWLYYNYNNNNYEHYLVMLAVGATIDIAASTSGISPDATAARYSLVSSSQRRSSLITCSSAP